MIRDDGDFNLGYFKIWPAPMYEAMCRVNPAEAINGTTPFYGPLLYVLGKILGAHSVLEIGVAQGWTSGFMAWAVKENNDRHQMNGRYWALDIGDKSEIQKSHDEIGLPSTFITHTPGSVDFLQNQKIWTPNYFDIIFIDGWHNIEYVKKEIELCYPLLKDNGNGYLVMHDIYSFCEGMWPWVVKYAEWEHMRFLPNYGLGILRNMKNYDHNKVFWPDGDQKGEDGFVT